MMEIVPQLQVLTAVAGGPNLLEAQLSAINKFFPASAKVLVVDDSRRRRHYSNNRVRGTAKRLREVADRYGAQYVRFPQYQHFMRNRLYQSPNPSPKFISYPSLRHADSLQYGLSVLGRGGEIQQLMILDSDMIPITYFKPENYFAEAAVWFAPMESFGHNGKIVYPMPVIFFADLAKAKSTAPMNWDYSLVDGVTLDTGGEMRPWMESNAHQSKKITGLYGNRWKWNKDSELISLCLEEFLTFDATHNNEMQFCDFFLGTFIHLRGGSNWDPARRDVLQERINLFTDGIKNLINE